MVQQRKNILVFWGTFFNFQNSSHCIKKENFKFFLDSSTFSKCIVIYWFTVPITTTQLLCTNNKLIKAASTEVVSLKINHFVNILNQTWRKTYHCEFWHNSSYKGYTDVSEPGALANVGPKLKSCWNFFSQSFCSARRWSVVNCDSLSLPSIEEERGGGVDTLPGRSYRLERKFRNCSLQIK